MNSGVTTTLDDIFHPQTIAVVGASENPGTFGHHYFRYLKEAGYQGKIYPVNPQVKYILGEKAFPDLIAIPGSVDYVICCINASLVIDLLHQCPAKKVKAIHLFTGRLSETGNLQARKLEEDILRESRQAGVRLIGPNCMGLYNPAQKITFNYDLPLEPGQVGAILQSGGIAGEFTRYAALRGIRFSKVISYGNALDINECDLLEYLSFDPQTKIIVIYIEGVRDGRRFLDLLRQTAATKPVIVLKGGRGKAGIKAVASHTASIAGSTNVWDIALRQYGAVQAQSLSELIDLTVAFSFLPPLTSRQVGIIGGGGGKSVLAADECEEAGLEVIPLPGEIKKILEKKDPQLADWLGNPVDFSILPGTSVTPIEMLRILAENQQFDFLLANVTEDNPYDEKLWVDWVEREISEYFTVAKQKRKPLAITMGNAELSPRQINNWRWKTLTEQRESLIKAGIPVYSSASQAARAISKMIAYYQKNYS